ncbi:MAG: flagellar hook-basal body complex protein, partial [Patescibacteria group bacterium]|nr:flagellar hook-basal body complex protein [Patescibacteria group bacterium]
GFLQITRPDGTLAFTRDGTLKVSENSVFVTSDGLPIEPQITIPQDATAISIGADGFVQAEVFGQPQLQQLGQLNLVKFLNPAGLKSVGQNLYEETFASGTPIIGQPTRDGFGRILQGYLESSNVNVVEEMVNMITGQRAYEINSRSIQAGDDMMTTVNNLRR